VWLPCALNFANSSVAAEEYPCKPEGDIESAWYRIKNMDPEYLIKFRLGDNSFAVPYAYETGRSTPERVNCTPIRTEFRFAFWMPDLRYSKKDVFYHHGWPPEEQSPQGSAYLVSVLYLMAIPVGEEKPPFPFASVRGYYNESAVRKLRRPSCFHLRDSKRVGQLREF